MTSETRARVRYAETDQMGVVYHSNYLVWFEIGRAELLRDLGLDYKSMERDHGCGIAVVEATVRYKRPARYDDELIIRTRVAGLRGSVLRFTYTIHRASEDDGPELLLTEGATTHVVVAAMKRVPMPAAYAGALRDALEARTATDELEGEGSAAYRS